MTETEAKQRIEKLKKEINYHRYLYHVLDRQEISDAALDSLKHELYLLEQKYPEFITPDSPTQRVGGKPLKEFKKVRHKVPMLSLNDAFEEEELREWEERLKRFIPRENFDYFAELKLDGFAISLVYKNGLLSYGATRGDGKIGEDVTQNLKTIDSIPLRLELRKRLKDAGIQKALENLIKKGTIEVRGEVFMTKAAFEKINKERKKKGEEVYANPRNTAAGSIRQLDPKVAASRNLDFLAYGLVSDVNQKTHQDEHKILPHLGFKTDQGRYCQTLDEVMKFFQKIQKDREKLPFQIDGIVISVNNNSLFKRLGTVGKAPRGSIALKFPAEEATSIVEDIQIQVGRTGALTPVAHLKPVKIGGVTVSRATLHNEDEIRRLGVRIGDTVIVQRAGDVIPDIVRVLPGLRTGKEKKFEMPSICPFCGSKTFRKEGEAAYYCSGKNCFAKQLRKITHFVGKGAFDIKGMGRKIIEQLMQGGFLFSPADIFKLKQNDLEPLERFAEKSASNLIKAINKSKKITLLRFLYALGIRYVGEETAQLLARELTIKGKKILKVRDLIDIFKEISLEDLESIQDIGPVVAKSIYDFFHTEENLKLLRELDKAGIQFEAVRTQTKEKILSGKTFVLTGRLEQMTRQEAKDKIKALGGRISSSVSKKTDYLLLGKEPGMKYNRAKEMRVRILREEEFLEMVKSG